MAATTSINVTDGQLCFDGGTHTVKVRVTRYDIVTYENTREIESYGLCCCAEGLQVTVVNATREKR